MTFYWVSDLILNLRTTSIVIAIIALLAAMIYFYLQSKDLPPGPIGLPYFGYWPFFKDETCHLQLDAMKRKYGDLFSFTSTGHLFINLGSAKAVRDVHISKGDYFGSRNLSFNFLNYLFEEGISFTQEHDWRVLRKFILQSMKERGMLSMKESIAKSINESITATIKELKSKKGEPINITKLMKNKSTEIMRETLFGDVGATEKQIEEVTGYYESIMSRMTATNLLLVGTFARYFIYPLTPGYHETKKNLEKIKKAFYKIIEDHKFTYDREYIRDVIDEYIREKNNRIRQGDSSANCFTDKALMSTLVQFVSDGVLSISSFICLFIKIVLDHPEAQEKIYEELIEIVGEREMSLEDKSKLTYTNAFFVEALRVSDFFPFFPTVECKKETVVRGYRIPKGAITLLNTFSAHHDPDTYEDPERFDPSRFINKDGARKVESPVTFGMGRHSCIGEGFTMMQVFMFVTSLIKNFQIKLPEGVTENTHELLLSGKLRIIVVPRN